MMFLMIVLHYQISPDEVIGDTDQRQIGIFLSVSGKKFQIFNQRSIAAFYKGVKIILKPPAVFGQ